MPELDRTGSADLLQGMLAAERSALQQNEEGSRLGRDPECVHRMRVATRRARAALRTASGVLEPEREERLRAELAWLGGVLGGVRDLDVLTARLRTESEALEAPDQVALEPLFAALAAERRQVRSSLTRALRSARYRRLLDELGDAAVSAPPANGKISLDKRAGKQFGRLVKSMEEIGAEPADEELHRARKLGKRARYAAELAAPQADKPTKKFLERAKAFQDVTGAHQDAVVAEGKLRALVAKGNRAQAFAAGRLAERERERQEAARQRLPKAWKELERAGQRTWS